MLCELCAAEEAYNEHHLIPRHCHRKNWWKKNFTREQMQQTVWLCKTCHDMLHELIPDEKVLGREFNTLALLETHPEVARYLEWKRKKARPEKRGTA